MKAKYTKIFNDDKNIKAELCRMSSKNFEEILALGGTKCKRVVDNSDCISVYTNYGQLICIKDDTLSYDNFNFIFDLSEPNE